MDTNNIMGETPLFIGLKTNPIYEIKNKSKYKGDSYELGYSDERELSFIKNFDDDINDNIVFWSYKKLRIDYIDKYNMNEEWYYPTFYIMTKGKLFYGIKPKTSKDFPYAEYIIHVLNNDESIKLNLLDEEDYNRLQPEDKKKYDFLLTMTGYNQMRLEATSEYCNKTKMKFLIYSIDNKLLEVSNNKKIKN